MAPLSRNRSARGGLSGRLMPRLAVLTGVGVVAAGIAIAIIVRDLPSPDELFTRRVIQSTKIYDRSGAVLLYEIHGEEKRTVIPFSEIPATIKNATVAIEDANFYRHGGIDLRGIARALLKDIASGNLRQGGSTITQQLVKNALLGRERSISRKVKEAVLAIVLEARLPKEKILDLYLNQIPYGQNAYGIEAAAQTYFGKHAKDLSASEAASLAALPRAPSYYSPYGEHRDELLLRKNFTIERMRELGYLTDGEADAARRETPSFLPAAKNIRAPHFVMYVRDYLTNRYGEEEVEQGGLVVTTTLDWDLQEKAETIILEYAERNERAIQAANLSLVAINPKSGEILAMVGSADYFKEPIPQGCEAGISCRLDPNVNSVIRLRQPGSAFKPFVYATAFAKGLRPETVLFDVPTEFDPRCGPDGAPQPGTRMNPDDCYHPGNYDEKFRGPVTLRQAIAQSLNVPSVKLLYLAGVEDSIRTAEAVGITSLGDRERFGLSLVLGGAEVKLLELASGYGVFAADGVLNSPVAVQKVTSAQGQVLEEYTASPRPIIDVEVARTINDVLSDNDARIPIFQPRSSLYFPERRVAAKTGTTQDYRDAWTVGYTPSVVVGVWAGNNDNTPMRQKGSGVMAAAPAWHEFTAYALAKFPPEEFISPTADRPLKPILAGVWQGDYVVEIDTASGKLATDLTPPETRRFAAFGAPHDPLHWIDRQDPLGPPPADPNRDPQYPNWEAAFQRWLATAGLILRPLSAAPQEFDDIHTLENQPRVSILATERTGTALRVRISVLSQFPIREVNVVAADRVVASRQNPVFPVDVSIPLDVSGGALEIRAYDLYGNIGSITANESGDG